MVEKPAGGQGDSRMSREPADQPLARALALGRLTRAVPCPRGRLLSLAGQACRSQTAGEKARICGPAARSTHWRCVPFALKVGVRLPKVFPDGKQWVRIDDAPCGARVLGSFITRDDHRAVSINSMNEPGSHYSTAANPTSTHKVVGSPELSGLWCPTTGPDGTYPHHGALNCNRDIVS